MSNSNQIFVYSPEGEPFEMTKANARDLTAHAGWTYTPPAHAPEAPAPETAQTTPPPPPAAKEETPPPPPPPEKSEPAPAKTEEKPAPAAKAEVTIEEVAAPAKSSKKADAAE